MLDLAKLALGRSAVARNAEFRTEALPNLPHRLIAVRAGEVLLSQSELQQLDPVHFPHLETAYLGSDADFNYFANVEPIDVAGEWLPLRNIGAALSDRDAGLATAATALYNWHVNHPVCSRCGGETKATARGWSRTCLVDGSQHFPRTDPAVIVLILSEDDKVLLARQRVWPAKQFSVIAGFVEAGETLEAACIREAGEEVGLKISEVTYLGSQPWPFPQSLMLGFRAKALTTEITPDGDEIEAAAWFSRSEFRAACEADEIKLPPHTSIARQMLDYWYGEATPNEWTR
ncbi:MAG: hypothetical protein RL038_465 [Actinomycetota bacterium]